MGDGEQDAGKRRLLATLLSLQPFLRDIPSSSGSSSSGSAPAPLSQADLQRERASAAALAAQARAALARLPTTADTDAALLAAAAQPGAQPMGPRHRQAVATRLENKRLLAAAAEALEQYGAALVG